MTISIPASMQTTYEEACDLFLSSDMTSKPCKIVYPPLRAPCINCLPGPFGGGSSVYRAGGPQEFSGICPLCNGLGVKETITTRDIRLRFYIGNAERSRNKPYQAPENIVDSYGYIIGPRTELVNIARADYLELNYTEATVLKFRLKSEPEPYGFGNKYFRADIGILK